MLPSPPGKLPRYSGPAWMLPIAGAIAAVYLVLTLFQRCMP